MTSSIDNKTNDYSVTVDKGTEFDGISSEIGKQIIYDENKSNERKLAMKNKDYFFTNYNDLVANNYGLIFDLKV